jgi:uncharacterized protein YciI
MFHPSTLISPPDAPSSPVNIFIVVDLPAPLGPRNPVKRPPLDHQVDAADSAEIIEIPRQLMRFNRQGHGQRSPDSFINGLIDNNTAHGCGIAALGVENASATGPASVHYLLFYEVVEDYAERRMALRAAHLAHAKAACSRGELLLGGALADPVDGAVLLFQGESPAAAEAFAGADPYVTNGLVTRWRIRPWATVIGEAAAFPLPL